MKFMSSSGKKLSQNMQVRLQVGKATATRTSFLLVSNSEFVNKESLLQAERKTPSSTLREHLSFL